MQAHSLVVTAHGAEFVPAADRNRFGNLPNGDHGNVPPPSGIIARRDGPAVPACAVAQGRRFDEPAGAQWSTTLHQVRTGSLSGESNDQIDSIAEVLAGVYSDSDLRRILVEHTADYSGHCRGCRYPTSAPPRWPCRLWEIGKATERLKHATRST